MKKIAPPVIIIGITLVVIYRLMTSGTQGAKVNAGLWFGALLIAGIIYAIVKIDQRMKERLSRRERTFVYRWLTLILFALMFLCAGVGILIGLHGFGG